MATKSPSAQPWRAFQELQLLVQPGLLRVIDRREFPLAWLTTAEKASRPQSAAAALSVAAGIKSNIAALANKRMRPRLALILPAAAASLDAPAPTAALNRVTRGRSLTIVNEPNTANIAELWHVQSGHAETAIPGETFRRQRAGLGAPP